MIKILNSCSCNCATSIRNVNILRQHVKTDQGGLIKQPITAGSEVSSIMIFMKLESLFKGLLIAKQKDLIKRPSSFVWVISTRRINCAVTTVKPHQYILYISLCCSFEEPLGRIPHCWSKRFLHRAAKNGDTEHLSIYKSVYWLKWLKGSHFSHLDLKLFNLMVC